MIANLQPKKWFHRDPKGERLTRLVQKYIVVGGRPAIPKRLQGVAQLTVAP